MPQPNYPDVLGYLTGGDRLNVGVVQVALALEPQVVFAGRPFKAILLVQNAADVDVELHVTLHLPKADHAGLKRPFFTKNNHILVGLRKAEVGYLVFHIGSLPDVAPYDAYPLTVEIDAQPNARPHRIRQQDAGGVFTEADIEPLESADHFERLSRLEYTVEKGGLLAKSVATTFSVLSSHQVAQLTDLKPAWVSLWTMRDFQHDLADLLANYGTLLRDRTLPNLKRHKIYEPIRTAASAKFEAGGFALHDLEAQYLAKGLIATLERALLTRPEPEAFPGERRYHVQHWLQHTPPADYATLTLPSWCEGMLRAIATNDHCAPYPGPVLANFALPYLMYDSVTYMAHQVQASAGTRPSDEARIQQFAEDAVAAICLGERPLTFRDAYLPLILGGVLATSDLVLPREDPSQTLPELEQVMHSRAATLTDADQAAYHLGTRVFESVMQRYTSFSAE